MEHTLRNPRRSNPEKPCSLIPALLHPLARERSCLGYRRLLPFLIDSMAALILGIANSHAEEPRDVRSSSEPFPNPEGRKPIQNGQSAR
jgi:hypothetical protein